MTPIARGSHIVILTGAGISKESGLDTFRDADGIWQKYKIENVATPDGFARNPELVHEFYNGCRRQLQEAGIMPNAAHLAIAELQREWPGRVTLITQNIDDLHHRAAREKRGDDSGIISMHGKLLESLCAKCGVVREIAHDLGVRDRCESCGGIGCVRPNIVWFGEMPYHMDRIYDALADCDCFVSIGTSGTVYPAAGFVAEAKSNGCRLAVELNLAPSDVNSYFDESMIGAATSVVPRLFRYWLDESMSRAAN